MVKKKKKKVHKTPKRKTNTKEVKDRVREIFSFSMGESFTYRGLIKIMGIRDKASKEALKETLFAMERSGSLKRASDGRFMADGEPQQLEGIVDHVNSRFAYIICDESAEDVWVKTEHLNYAVDGDRVMIKVTRPAMKGFRPEGKVVKIIERAKTEFVGRIEVHPKFSFVIPDNKNFHFDVFVYPEKIGKSRSNDKVVVKIQKWHDARSKNPLGEVVEVLGQAGENEAEIHSIMAEFGLPFRFPDKIEEEANKISTAISKKEITDRWDFRQITTFTIDPEDAKDFDDALSIRKLENGLFEIGVHIADVSHYVVPGTLLDKEAYRRATSVYLVDRTIPMLPEKLSNELCSLRPNEDKLTFSAVFEMDEQAVVKKKWFGRTIIHSDRRFTYEEAQERIERGAGDFSEEINTLNNLALKLCAKRFNHGAVKFETTEVKFRLDEKGKPLEVIPKVRKEAHKMIEEFMLLANREVATHVFKWNGRRSGEDEKTFVYRTHDEPDPEKLDNFSKFAFRFGHQIDMEKSISAGLNKLMEEIEGKPEQDVLEQLAIRAMAKAKYTTEAKGHFGLAFDHYTHFTSPIRRYPDVMVHRLLWHYLQKGDSADRESNEKKCVHSSEREKNAADAERASIKYKQVEFMQSALGEEFEGIVSGVTEWGVYVEIIKTKCEGMVRLSEIEDDFYEFDEKNYRIIGRRNKGIITLGDKLMVRVIRTDIDRRTIDLELITK